MNQPVTTRPAQPDDRQRCIWIEDGAIAGIRYIDDVWPLFQGAGDGELTLALEGGTVGGMGKLTRLYGRYCWLESLRVHPDFQNKGLGKAIYRRYMAQMEEHGTPSCGMYTGYDNTHSRHLAELFGLELAGRFSEYQAAVLPGALPEPFTPVSVQEAEGLLAPHYLDMGDFLVVNRTWFPVSAGLGTELARRGWVYRLGDTLLVAGSRFQPRAALHVPFMAGDMTAALAYAHTLAEEQGAAKLTAIRPHGQPTPLTGHGFDKTEHDLITLWKDL